MPVTDPAPRDPADDAALAGFPVTPPVLPRPVFTSQRWRDLTFLHWPVEPGSIAHLFPPGSRPDVFADGLTYVALVPFAMTELALGIASPIPYFGTFLETNVRLYSTDGAGRHGVLFRSLETSRLAVVPISRLALGVPYTWARMRMTRGAGSITYDSVRRLPHRGLRSRVAVELGELVEPTPLETWLTSRWGAHTRKAGRTWWVPNTHGPFPFRAAEVTELDDELVAAAGVRPAGPRLRALHSPGVTTRFGRPTVVADPGR